jgi:secondary thiamine-phosphate synthase enzyme
MIGVEVPTARAMDTVDITRLVQGEVGRTGVAEGVALVYCPHTTAGVFVNEGADPDVAHDIRQALDSIVTDSPSFRHSEGNSPAHVKSVLVGNSVMLPISGGQLVLGTWQHVFLAEFDGPRTRRVLVQVLDGGLEIK